jgi:hypothetical protein
MPPFYIGSKDIQSVLNGYRGSVVSKEYKNVFKNEPSKLFKTKIISQHKTREEAYIKEKEIHLNLQVHISPLYINKTIAYSPIGISNKGRKQSKKHIENKIKSLKNTYKKLGGHPNKGKKNKPATEERKEKISKANKGKVGNMLGLKHSTETILKMQRAALNRSKTLCPHCLQKYQPAPLKKYHGDNCKLRNSTFF